MRVQLWVQTAEDDWKAAQVMLAAGHWSHAAFLCHECLEKLLKALIIHRLSRVPPSSHTLLDLLRHSGLQPPVEVETALLKVSPHYAVARYPDAAGGRPSAYYNEALAKELMQSTTEVKTWLEPHLK